MFDKLIKSARSKSAQSKAAVDRFISYLKKRIELEKLATEDMNIPESMPVNVVQEPVQQLNLLETPFISFQVWRTISINLPLDYMLPNPESVDILFPKTSDYYRDLFTIPSKHRHLMVDDQVWRRIKDALPNHFQIPDPRLTSDLK
jgi:hypothetical protein